MAGRKSDFTLPTLDDLFSTQELRDDAKLSKIRDIPLELIDDFPDHPFKVRDDEDMIQLVESVKERGVITPATVRQKEDGRYELISGHRRKRACELAGFEALRCEVVAVPQSSRQAYRKVTPKQQRFPIRLTTARQCCHSQANLKRKQTSPNADRKPLPRLKKNSPHLRQLRNRRHRNHRKKNLLSRSLTLTTGSALPRATLRASDLRSTAEPCIAGITPSPQV